MIHFLKELFTPIDILCKNDKCPICGGKVIFDFDMRKSCRNGCYIVVTWKFESYSFSIFNSESAYIYNLGKREVIKHVKKQIRYWRKNERYLLKIMGRTDNEADGR